MILPLLLVAALSAAQPADVRAAAERQARSGAHAAALETFQRLAAADPDDLDARMWIGRLYLWLGNPAAARPVFEGILLARPAHVEALLGLAGAAMNTGDRSAANAALQRAEAAAPEAADVLAARGRYHRLGGRLGLAAAYYDRAALLSPADRDIRDARETVRAARAHRIEAGYQFERFSLDIPDTHVGSVEINIRAGDRARLFARGQSQRKFAITEERAGGGAEWMPNGRFHLRAGALFGGTSVILPRGDAAVEVDYGAGRVTWLASTRYLHFPGSDVWIGSAGASFAFSERIGMTARYYRSETAFAATDSLAGNNAVSLVGTVRATSRIRLSAGYARGYESFETLTSDRLRQRGAQTLDLGGSLAISPWTSVGATYEYQRRDDRSRLTTASLNIVQRF